MFPFGTQIDLQRLSKDRTGLGLLLASRSPSLINIGGIGFNDNMPLRNQPPVINTVAGAMDIQKFEDRMSWLSQAGDPVAWAPFIRKSPLPGNSAKNVIIQFARGDETVPNPTTTALIRSGDLADRTTLFRNDLAYPLGIGFSKNPHTFLFDLTSCLTITGCNAAAGAAFEAQTQIAVFFKFNGFVTIDPDTLGLVPPLPFSLFDTPIVLPLPEDTAYIP